MFRNYCLVLFAIGGSAAFGQVVGGTVESVSGNVLYINTGAQPVTLYTDARTEVWKGRIFHDLSPVATGDDISARYRTEADGRLVAETLWLNITNISAVITKVADTRFEVFTNPNADLQSAYKKENKTIDVDADTAFEGSAAEDLKPGRNVQVVGLVLGNGEIRATRVTVYEGNRPVRMRGDAVVIRPDGSRVTGPGK
jgi:hypothetical protein